MPATPRRSRDARGRPRWSSCSKARPCQRCGQLIGSVGLDDLRTAPRGSRGRTAPGPRGRLVRQLRLEHVRRQAGGVPRGRHAGRGRRSNPGARDSALPRRSVPVDLPGALYFAGDSRQWGGGVAFYDHDAREPGQGAPTAARPTWSPRSSSPTWPRRRCTGSRRRATRSRRSSSGASTVVGTTSVPVATRRSSRSAVLDDAPMLLFTSPHGIDHVEHTRPSASYLRRWRWA